MKNNWKPVIGDIIHALLKYGLTLHTVDNGDGEVLVDSIDEAIEEINATDESTLYVKNPDGKNRWIYIVLGNEPFETICDYTCDPLIDKAHEEFSNMWEGRSVPMIEEDWVAKFCDLALGTKFSYTSDPSKTFVKLSNSGGIVEWDDNNVDTKWVGQLAFTFDTGKIFGQKVIVRESRN